MESKNEVIDFDSHVKVKDYWFKKSTFKQSDAVEICRKQY